MIIDHFGLFFCENSWLRIIGRGAMPIFTFFAGYNYYFVKEREKVNFCFEIERYLNIFILAILLQIIIWLYIPAYSIYNIIFSILMGLGLIDIIDLVKPNKWLIQILALIFLPLTYRITDYGTFAFAFCYLGYIYNSRKDIIYMILAGFWLYAFGIDSYIKFSANIMQSFLLACIVIFQFWVFNFWDFKKIINWKFLLVSRYILPIYFWHVVLFVLCYGVVNYTKFHS